MNWLSIFDFERGPSDGVMMVIIGLAVLLMIVCFIMAAISDKGDKNE